MTDRKTQNLGGLHKEDWRVSTPQAFNKIRHVCVRANI